jgi:hypothetical protein
MTLATLLLLILAVGLAWWVVRRTVAYRREAASREARVLEALFAARHAGDGGASIDVDRIFGGASAPAVPAGPNEVLQAELAGLLNKPPAERAAAATAASPVAGGPAFEPVDAASSAPAAAPSDAVDVRPEPAAPVRDLVQVFFEARGFRPAPLGPTARPIEAVLSHGSDEQRAYAFVPLAQPPSEKEIRSLVECARGLGRKRVLIAVEGPLSPDTGGELPAHGVRILDRAAIETQLARLDAAVADRIRTRARQLAGQRLTAG